MLPEYKKILYATDLTENAAHAFRHAVSLARHYDSRIWFLHALPEIDASVINYVSTVMGEKKLTNFELQRKEEVVEEIRQRLKDFAAEELADHPEDLKRVAQVEVHHGNPVSVILTLADQIDADLIVLGSHGKGRMHYTFLGSVAEKVLRKTMRTVMVVPLR